MRMTPLSSSAISDDGRVEQVAVVGDHHDGAVEVVQQRAEALAPGHVQVRLGLVEQQHVGAAGEAGRERDELALPAGELARGHLEQAPVDAERAQVAQRLALGAVAAGVLPAREHALVVGERARHRVEVARQMRVRQPLLGRVQLGLEHGQLRPGGAHGGARVAPVAVDDLRQVREHEPAAADHGPVVGVLEPGDDAQERRLAAAVGAEDADPRPASTSRSVPRRILRPPNDLVTPRTASNDMPLASTPRGYGAIEPAAPDWTRCPPH